MTFITGTITDSNPGPQIYARIETAALADGWLLDDSVTIGGNTHRVLKSPAAGNVRNLDWWLDINFPTTGIAGGMRFAPFEFYNPATDLATRGPIQGGFDNVIETTYYSRYGATQKGLETDWNNQTGYTISTGLTTASFTYYISITRNRIIALFTNNPSELVYTGFYTPTTEYIENTAVGGLLFPLVMLKMPSASNVQGGNASNNAQLCVTRVPKFTAFNWSGANLNCTGIGQLVAGQVGVAPAPTTNETVLSPMVLIFGTAPNTGFVGVLDGMAHGYVNAVAVRGDTVTINADTWYMTTPNATSAAFMRAV